MSEIDAAVATARAAWSHGLGDRGCHDNAALVAAYERGVVEGRRQAADDLFETLRTAGVYAVHTSDGRLYQLADVAFAVPTADIAEGAPAEPVGEAERES